MYVVVLYVFCLWFQDLDKYSGSAVPKANGGSSAAETGLKLERDFDKELSLLWDMSSETDVMEYLVDKDIFQLLQNTLLTSASDRLTVTNRLLTQSANFINK